ncbi:Vigilin [Trachipleistophora hominis]|uniref:Vigilin n=1 Tax=Trachipleistophora hominis TaxID=72359 RepID=L7JTW1_TRAHO|nr:Vigilin [Trachipleistophora hominis]
MDALNKKFGVPDDYVFIIDIRSVNNTIINESVQDMRRALIENANVVCDRSTDSARMMISNISRSIRSNFFFYLSKGIRVFLDVEVPVCLFNYKKRLMDEIKKISEDTNVLIFLQIGNDQNKDMHCKAGVMGQGNLVDELYGKPVPLKRDNDNTGTYNEDGQYLGDKAKTGRFSVSPNCYCTRTCEVEGCEKDAYECEHYDRNGHTAESCPNYEYNEDSPYTLPLSNSESLFSDSSGNFEEDHSGNRNRNESEGVQRSIAQDKCLSPNYIESGNLNGPEPNAANEECTNTGPEKEQDAKEPATDLEATNRSFGTGSLQADSEITIQINGRWKESAIARLKILKFIENCFGNDLKFINCERTYFNLENKRRYYYGTRINYKLAITQNMSDKEIIARRNFDDVYFFEIDTVKLFYLFYYHKKQIEDVLCSYHSFFETSKINNTCTTVKLTGKNHKIVQKAIMGMTEDIFKVLITDVPYPIPDTFIFKTHERSMVIGKKPGIIELLKYRDMYCHVQIELSKELEEFLCGKKNGKINRIIKDTGTKINIMVNNVMTIYISGQSANVCVAIHAVENEFPEELAFHLSERHHKRIIGFGGKNIQRIMKKHGVYIKFMSEYERRQNNYSGNVVVKTPRKNREALEKMKNEILQLADEKEYKREIVQIRITLFEFFLFFIVRAVGYRMLFDEVILSFSRGTDTFLFKDYFFEVDRTPFENLLLESEKVGVDEVMCEVEAGAVSKACNGETRHCTGDDKGSIGTMSKACNGETRNYTGDDKGSIGTMSKACNGETRHCTGDDKGSVVNNNENRPASESREQSKEIHNEGVNDDGTAMAKCRNALEEHRHEQNEDKNTKPGVFTVESNMPDGTLSEPAGGDPKSFTSRCDKSTQNTELVNKDRNKTPHNRSAINNSSENVVEIIDPPVHKQNAEIGVASRCHSDTTVNNKPKETFEPGKCSQNADMRCFKETKFADDEMSTANEMPFRMGGTRIDTESVAFDGGFDRRRVGWEDGNRRYYEGSDVLVDDQQSVGEQAPTISSVVGVETADTPCSAGIAGTEITTKSDSSQRHISPSNADEDGNHGIVKNDSATGSDQEGGESRRYHDQGTPTSNKSNESSHTTATDVFIIDSHQHMQYVNDETMKMVNHINSIMPSTSNISTISLSGICTKSMIMDVNDVVGLNSAKKEFYFDILGQKEKHIKKISPFYYQIGKNYRCTYAFAHTITLKDGSLFLRSFQQIEQHQDGVNALVHISALRWYEERKLAFKIFHSQLFYSYENSLSESKIGDESGSSDSGPKIGSLLTVGFEKGKRQSSMK